MRLAEGDSAPSRGKRRDEPQHLVRFDVRCLQRHGSQVAAGGPNRLATRDDAQPADDPRALRLADEELEPRVGASVVDDLRTGGDVAGDATTGGRPPPDPGAPERPSPRPGLLATGPDPATVRIVPSGETRRTRLSSQSAMRNPPSASAAASVTST